MTSKNLYFYDEENRLESRNTYFYSPYAGRQFLSAWRASRSKLRESVVLKDIENDSVEVVNLVDGNINATRLFSYIESAYSQELYEQVTSHLKILVKRFEATKRIYDEYDCELRAVSKTSYHNLELYLRFSEILVIAYYIEKELPYLNALLKIIDTLSSVSGELTHSERQRLSEVVKKEETFIKELMEKIGLEELCE